MDKMQFVKGQMIVYGTNGICIIDDIRQVRLMPDSKPELYYILRQKRDEQTSIYVPVDNEKLTSKMRAIMSRDDLFDMLSDAKENIMEWDRDRRARNDLFRDIMSNGVSVDLFRMILCLYERRRYLETEGKKLPVTDNNILKAAKKLLEEEFAFVLDMKEEEIKAFVLEELGIDADIE